MSEKVMIERIGHLGDGLAGQGESAVHIPFAAPGDVFERADAQSDWRLAQPGPHRIQAPCAHYGVCGGCNLQHVYTETYLASKREWVIAALARQGLNAPVDEMLPIAPGARRRATFAATGGKTPLIGFHRERSNDIAPVPHCLVVRPRIINAIDAVRGLLEGRLPARREARITITEADSGLDVAIEAPKVTPMPLGVPEIETARLAFIVRATWNDELLFATDTVRLALSSVRVDLPVGAFIQATKESEAALAARVAEGLSGAKRIADLYAGVGTFTFAVATSAVVDAFEGHAFSVDALVTASRRAQLPKPVSGQTRDLARRPLMAAELKPYDAAILDPPRIGAETQARQLARSGVGRIAYVSCHPASFARDARTLCDGGYKLTRVSPVDQFLWSNHIELVGVFER
ncbi:MAG: RNA methyltransferase [Alphaproteobacteria bacterium]